jgi:putative FmdB family regulatory protein
MPIFEYVCQECNHHFEKLSHGGESPVCPQCESGKLEQQLSRFAVGSGKPAARRSGGGCGGCCDPGGACSMN